MTTEHNMKKQFLAELAALCKLRGFSLGHEDRQGGFVVTNHSGELEAWLLDADCGPDGDQVVRQICGARFLSLRCSLPVEHTGKHMDFLREEQPGEMWVRP